MNLAVIFMAKLSVKFLNGSTPVDYLVSDATAIALSGGFLNYKSAGKDQSVNTNFLISYAVDPSVAPVAAPVA